MKDIVIFVDLSTDELLCADMCVMNVIM